MAYTTSPREYSRRLTLAKEFFKQHTYAKVRQMQDPVAEYKYRLGELATRQPMMVKTPSRDGNPSIKEMEHLVGARFLSKPSYKCDQARYSKMLESLSPNAGMRQVVAERKAYCGERATQAKLAVDRAKEGRDLKDVGLPGRLKSAQHKAQYQGHGQHQPQVGKSVAGVKHNPVAAPGVGQKSVAQQQDKSKAVPYTPGVKVSMQADKEYGKRLHEAQQFYVQHQHNGTLSKDPATQYKFELGKAALKNPEHFRIQDKTGNPNIDAVDVEIGKKLIAKGVCNRESYQKALQDYSPNAGILENPNRREQYAKGMAGVSDRSVNSPNTRPDRTKHGESIGRATSTIEERANRQTNHSIASRQYKGAGERER